MTRVTTIFLLVVMLAGSAGCIGEADLVAARDRAGALAGALRAQERALQRQHGQAGGELERRRIEEDLAITQAQRTALEAAITQVDHALERSADGGDPLGAIVGAVAAWLPAGTRLPALLGAGLALSALRLVRMQRAAESIVDSVAKAARQDPGFRDRLEANADTLRAIQTPAAAALVDRRQRRGA
ncbi:MAG: hypothetical protein ACF8R7_17675 [Phycisphaerales bacterium JB039]